MIKKIETIKFPTKFGDFQNIIYEIKSPKEPYTNYAFVIHTANIFEHKSPLVRIHSSCIFSEVFGSLVCDCSSQLEKTLKMFAQKGGIFIYIDQEGRSHGLFNKVKELKLQEQGLDTYEASEKLGLEIDSRIYNSIVKILKELNVLEIKLVTNNPAKVKSISDLGIKITERVPIETPGNGTNNTYLKTKKEKMGHILTQS